MTSEESIFPGKSDRQSNFFEGLSVQISWDIVVYTMESLRSPIDRPI